MNLDGKSHNEYNIEVVENEPSKKSAKEFDDETSATKTPFMKSYWGLFYAFLGSIIIAAGQVFLKKATYFNGAEKALVKYGIQFAVVLTIILCLRQRLCPRTHRIQLSMLAVSSVCGVLASMYALSYLNPTDLVALVRFKIVLVTIGSRFLFKEMLTFSHILAMILTLAGVILICNPSFLREPKMYSPNNTFADYFIGVSLGLTASFLIAAGNILNKKLTNEGVNYFTLAIIGSYLGIPFCTVLVLVSNLVFKVEHTIGHDVPVNESSLFWQVFFITFGAACFVTHLILTLLALKHEDASKVVIVASFDILFAYLFQYEFLDIISPWMAYLGASFIVLASILIAVYKMYDRGQQPQSIFSKFLLYKF